jgi:hypothetical protein
MTSVAPESWIFNLDAMFMPTESAQYVQNAGRLISSTFKVPGTRHIIWNIAEIYMKPCEILLQ